MIKIKEGKIDYTVSELGYVKEYKLDITGCKYGDIGDLTCILCDVVLNDKVHIAIKNVFIGKGKVTIGEGTSIAPNCVFYTSMPNKNNQATNKYVIGHESIIANIKIGKNVFIGANSVIGCGAIIQDGVWLPPFSHVKPFEVIGK